MLRYRLHNYCMYDLLLYIFVIRAGITQSKVTLTSNLDERTGNIAYRHQIVTFQCIARGNGTQIISWLSEDYIGSGEETLQITSIQRVGHKTNNSQNPSTIATLVNITIIDSDTESELNVSEIVSELQLTASVHHPAVSYVRCRLNGNGESSTITFSKADII